MEDRLRKRFMWTEQALTGLLFRYTVISGVGDSNGIALDSQIRRRRKH